MIPIFDSLTHPTISGKWLSGDYNAEFNALHTEMESNNVINACAVGLPNVGEYNHIDFINNCSNYHKLIPIAGFDLFTDNIDEEISQLKKIGFKGLKLHPRCGNFSFENDHERIVEVMNSCYEHDLVVFICTYFSSEIDLFPNRDPFWDLVNIFKKSSKTKTILVHGGLTRIMQYADLVRFNSNILLDLSYTIIKYRGSSLDLDIKYLFESFDRKLCIGSDHPEFTIKDLRERLDLLNGDVPKLKLENIYFKNLLNFFNV